MVTPNQQQADSTMKATLRRLLQLNHDQEFSYSRDELVALLDKLHGEMESGSEE